MLVELVLYPVFPAADSMSFQVCAETCRRSEADLVTSWPCRQDNSVSGINRVNVGTLDVTRLCESPAVALSSHRQRRADREPTEPLSDGLKTGNNCGPQRIYCATEAERSEPAVTGAGETSPLRRIKHL
ncbi:hypothetical protein EYF80_036649 [Liparis tanakae]|uniref:Uncharacterized protein n=1 Tax=Liparis tanakae TaxID=230148 RepID=A0A4Z2GIL7_9TELE|nr:hypothetical protein EYF80_036649 [Liparis tanakae]